MHNMIRKQPTIATLPLEGNASNLGPNNKDFLVNGSLVFYNEGNNPNGKYSVGPFAVSDYLSSMSTVNSEILNKYKSHSIEIIFKANSISNGPVISAYKFGVSASQANTIRVLSNGAIRIILEETAFADSSAGIVVPGTWYVYGYTYDGTTAKGYIVKYGSTRKTVQDITVTRATTGSSIDLAVGRSKSPGGFELPFNGLISSFRVWGELKTYFPQGQ